MRDSTPTRRRPIYLALIVGLLTCLPGLQIARAGTDNSLNRIRSASQRDTPAVDRILVDLDAFRLYTFRNNRLVSQYPVAVGMDTSPTPTGRFRIVNKLKNPWYTPDDKPARAPGPDNPLGTRWMGLNKPSYGLHGTREPGSIGSRASEGCIRLRNEDAERLYRRVRRGTRVVIRKTSNSIRRSYISPATPSYAGLSWQGSYSSQPSLVGVPSTKRRTLGSNANERCRLKVPTGIPFPSTITGPLMLTGPSGPLDAEDRRISPPTNGRFTPSKMTRWPSFPRPRSCEETLRESTADERALVCFLLSKSSGSKPSVSRVSVSPDRRRVENDVPRRTRRMVRPERQGSRSRFGGKPASESTPGSSVRFEETFPRSSSGPWQGKPFSRTREAKRCEGTEKTGHGVDFLDCGIP